MSTAPPLTNAQAAPPTAAPAPATNDKPPRKSLKQLSFLIAFLKPYWPALAGTLIALTVSSSAVLLLGEGLKFVIDRGFKMGDAVMLDRALLGLAATIVTLGVASYFRFTLIFWVAERVTADLRQRVFSHILKLSPEFFETTRTGEVISRLTSDTALVQGVVVGAFSYALRNLVMLVGGFVMLWITSWKLTLLVLAGIPFVLVPIVVLGGRVRKLSREQQDRVSDVSTFVDETLHEIRTVQAYAHEPIDAKQFGLHAEAVFTTAMRRARTIATLSASVVMLAFGSIGLVLWVGGHRVLAGALSAGELSAFVYYAMIVATGTYVVSEVYGELQRAAGASERLLELLATPPKIVISTTPKTLPQGRAQGHIRFEHVQFNYPSRPTTAALSDFNLVVAPDEVVALVGPSGAGKTTVFQLLLRFYDVAGGQITLDGLPIRDLAPGELRSQIALVSQESVIFAASVAENVRYARPDATDAEVQSACAAAYASEFIEQLPQGMNTPLGERGVKLSGGQRQRIAIARAILADRPILLLDEATSALDAESEKAVQLALAGAMKGRTTLVIAHRLATVQNANRIVVIEGGMAVGLGTHDQLIQSNALYARLAALQFNAAAS